MLQTVQGKQNIGPYGHKAETYMAEDTGLRPPSAANLDFPLRTPGNIHASQPTASEPARKVSLHVAAVAMLNLADFQNAVPALGELAVCNETSAAISDLTLTVTSEPAFLKPRTWNLDIVGAGNTYQRTQLDVELDGALLPRLTEAEPATLCFELRSATDRTPCSPSTNTWWSCCPTTSGAA